MQQQRYANSRALQIDQVRGRLILRFQIASPQPIQLGLESLRITDVEGFFPPSESTEMMLHPPAFQCRYVNASHSGMTIKFWVIGFPHWLLLLSLASPLEITIVSRLRSRLRIRSHRCGTCGYDLTANTSGVCPECGTPVPKKPEAIA